MIDTSQYGEQGIILHYLEKIEDNITSNQIVDIGAGDGYNLSNTRYLTNTCDKDSILIEANELNINALYKLYCEDQNVNIIHERVTPSNVCNILASNDCDHYFTFLNLDIDGYDYHVLDALLNEYRPSLICCEINEKIPPPIFFTVNYSDDYQWEGHFYGMSITAVNDLCIKYNYSLVYLNYINAFLIPREFNIKSINIYEAYYKHYLNVENRHQLFGLNEEFNSIYSMTTQEQLDFINEKFKDHSGQYSISIKE